MANVFADLRAKYFELPRPDAIKISSAAEPWGAIMEIGYPQAVVTTVAFADGTASVLRSTGGGFFGGGDASVQQARLEFLRQSHVVRSKFASIERFPEPSIGNVSFSIRTDQGVCSASASLLELDDEDHPLRYLYLAGLSVLHEYLRLQKQTQK
jgi:hypothetical protein